MWNYTLIVLSIGSSVKSQPLVAPHMSDSSVIAKENLQKIKDIFAPLLSLAHRVLKGRSIDISDLRLFLTAHYLPDDDSNDAREIDPSKFVSQVLGTAQTVSEILESLMVHRLLSYKNFKVLRSVINHYASDDIEMKNKLDEYEQ